VSVGAIARHEARRAFAVLDKRTGFALLAVVVLLAAVAAIACAVPAWRAARVDPASTLRTE
jgi:hypothetical protein